MDKQELLRRLTEGEDPRAVLAVMDQDPQSPVNSRATLLRRSSLLRSFDPTLLEGAISKGLGVSQERLSEFLSSPELVVESVSSNRYSLKESTRKAGLEWWARSENRSSLEQFARSLLDASISGSEAIGLRVLIDREAACADFREAYRIADEAADFSQCESLLNVFRWYGPLLPDMARSLLNEREAYFNSRVKFADDWTRSGRYIPRSVVTDKFKNLQVNPAQWIFQIHGKGGSGKTAYLRWLTSRHCVPEPKDGSRRTLVAQVDMDFVRIPQLASDPWLILLLVARQLDTQLPNRPFASVFQSWLSFAPWRDAPESSRPPERSLISTLAEFSSALGEYSRVVIVLDTMEELVLRHQESLLEVLDILSQLHDRFPELKLVVSGRYDVLAREDLTGAKRFRDVMLSVPIGEFAEGESEQYLRDIRGLRSEAYDVAAMVRKCARMPFKLALCADLAIARGRMTGQDLLKMASLETEYLIERIIDRIPDSEMPVRWLLRYAVIPRPGRLDYDFVANVLRPHLEREMRKLGLTLQDSADPGRWKQVEGAHSLDDIWRELLKYRSESGWIVMRSEKPELQPEILVPMRAMLQMEQIFCRLHRDAALYYEKRNEANEAAYHWFWAEGPEAVSRWRALLRDAPTIEKAFAVAAVVCEGGLVDDELAPLPHWVFGTAISQATVIEGFFERASLQVRSDLILNRFDRPLKQAESDLNLVERLEARLGQGVIPVARKTLVKAALLAAQGNAAGALMMLEDASTAIALEPHEAAVFNVLQARLTPEAARAVEYLQAAADISLNDPRPATFPLSWLRLRQGSRWFDASQLEDAEHCYELALASLRAESAPVGSILNCLETLITIHRSQLRYWKADIRVAEAAQMNQSEETVRAFTRHYSARMLLDRGKLRNAWVSADYGNASLDGKSVGRQKSLFGDLYAAGREFDESAESYEDAMRVFRQIKAEPEESEALLRKARMCLDDKGDLNSSLQQRLFSNPRPSLAALAYELEVIRLARQHKLEDARRFWVESGRRLWSKDGDNFRPGDARSRARWLGLGLALNLAPALDLLGGWLVILKQVHPWEARLPLLDPFRNWRLDKDLTIPREHMAEFMKLFPNPNSADPDFRYQALALAPVIAFMGGREAASGLVREALEAAAPAEVLLRRKLVLAAQQFHYSLPQRYLLLPLEGAAELQPALRMSLQVEIAELLWQRGQRTLARQTLALAGNAEIEALRGSQYEFRHYRLVSAFAGDQAKRGSAARQVSIMADRLGWTSLTPLEEGFTDEEPANISLPQVTPDSDKLEIRPGLASPPKSIRIDWRGVERKPLSSDSGRLPFPNLFAVLPRTACQGDWKNLDQAASTLKDFLPDEYTHQSQTGRKVDCAFYTAAGNLAGLPWEAAIERTNFRYIHRVTNPRFPETTTVMWMQEWLSRMGFPCEIDGVLGEATATLLAEAGERLGLPEGDWSSIETKRRMASLLVPTRRFVVSMGLRNSTHYERHDVSLEGLYKRRGLDLIALELEPASTPLPKYDAYFIHIPMGFVETHSAITLNVIGPQSNPLGAIFDDTGSGHTAESLAIQLHGNSQPFVLLDTPHPGHQHEYERQLLLRNQFAYDLMSAGACRGVLACGLVEPGYTSLRQTLDAALAGIVEGRCLGEIAQLAGRMSVLFCSDPALPAI